METMGVWASVLYEHELLDNLSLWQINYDRATKNMHGRLICVGYTTTRYMLHLLNVWSVTQLSSQEKAGRRRKPHGVRRMRQQRIRGSQHRWINNKHSGCAALSVTEFKKKKISKWKHTSSL